MASHAHKERLRSWGNDHSLARAGINLAQAAIVVPLAAPVVPIKRRIRPQKTISLPGSYAFDNLQKLALAVPKLEAAMLNLGTDKTEVYYAMDKMVRTLGVATEDMVSVVAESLTAGAEGVVHTLCKEADDIQSALKQRGVTGSNLQTMLGSVTHPEQLQGALKKLACHGTTVSTHNSLSTTTTGTVNFISKLKSNSKVGVHALHLKQVDHLLHGSHKESCEVRSALGKREMTKSNSANNFVAAIEQAETIQSVLHISASLTDSSLDALSPGSDATEQVPLAKNFMVGSGKSSVDKVTYLEESLLRPVLQAMKKWGNESEVISTGLQELTHLCRGPTIAARACRRSAASIGVVTVILASIAAHLEDVDVVRYALTTLVVLCSRSEQGAWTTSRATLPSANDSTVATMCDPTIQCIQMTTGEGIFSYLPKVQKLHLLDEAVQEQAARLLMLLCSSDDTGTQGVPLCSPCSLRCGTPPHTTKKKTTTTTIRCASTYTCSV